MERYTYSAFDSWLTVKFLSFWYSLTWQSAVEGKFTCCFNSKTLHFSVSIINEPQNLLSQSTLSLMTQ